MAVQGQNSVYGDPPNHQAEQYNTAEDNATAHIDPYTDRSITKRNVAQEVGFEPTDTPKRSGSKTQGNIRRFYAEDRVEEIDQVATNPGVDPPPHSPNSWLIETDDEGISRSRDYYRNNGMISQGYLENQG